jgi:hypothetical protein
MKIPKARWIGDPNWTLLKDAHRLTVSLFESEYAAQEALRNAFADKEIETRGIWINEKDGSITYVNIHVNTDQLLHWLEKQKRARS